MKVDLKNGLKDEEAASGENENRLKQLPRICRICDLFVDDVTLDTSLYTKVRFVRSYRVIWILHLLGVVSGI